MRLIPEHHLAAVRRPVAGARLSGGGADLFRPHHHHPVRLRRLRIAAYAFWPFGRTVVDKPGTSRGADRQRDLGAAVRDLAGHRPCGHRRGDKPITIVGIPLALANLKLIPVSLMPLGRTSFRSTARPTNADAGMTVTSLGLPAVRCRTLRPIRTDAAGRAAGRHLRPGRHRSAGVAHRPLQSAVHLLHAGRGLDWLPGDDLLTLGERSPDCSRWPSPVSASPASASPAASRCSTAGSKRSSPPPRHCVRVPDRADHQRCGAGAPRAAGSPRPGWTG